MQCLASSLAIAVLAATASAQFLVIPNGTGTSEGNSSDAFPWGRGGAGLRHQCLYDSSHFTLQGITTPILITGLRWRPNTGGALVASSYTQGAFVRLSTAPVDALAPSATFVANQGSDLTACFNGVVSWLSQPAQAGPTPFGINIPFTTNFYYDPALGDLNVECDLPIQTFTGTTPLLDVQTTGSASSRVAISAGYPGSGVGTITTNHGVVLRVGYQPAVGLFSRFTANVTGGATPLTVQFSDRSYSSDPGGVTSWAWDFDGDNVTDSTLQNPTFVYTTCGNYGVTLRVTDASHPASTRTLPGFIKTDRIVANFTARVVAPLTVQFTDTSNMPATSWAWDLDGDSFVDSNLQNPTWAYASASPVNVTLTVARLCTAPSTLVRQIVPVQQITTNLSPNANGSSLWAVFLDVAVANPLGANIDALDVLSSTVSAPFSLAVYLKPGSYVGSEQSAAAWTLVGTATGTASAIANQPSAATFASPLHLPAGSYGLAMRYIGIAPSFLNSGAPAVVGDGDLTLTMGAALGSTAAPFTGTSLLSPRLWSGTVYYQTHNVTAVSGYGFFAPGCAGSMGTSHLSANHPQIGTTLQVNLGNLPLSVAIMMIGFSNTSSAFGPLPVAAAAFGAPGCFGRVSPDATAFLIGGANAAVLNFPIPAASGLIGVRLFNQALVPDPGQNTLGAVFGDAAAMIIGL